MVRRRFNIPDINDNDKLTAPSDNTRVVSPYRLRQLVESQQKRQSVDIRSTVQRLRKEQEQKLEKERREREDEERRIENEKYYKRLLQEKQESYEREKAEREQNAKEEAKKSEELYEQEYKTWLEDVLKNPSNYNSNTQEVVKRAMHSYKHPNDYLARLDRGIARALFGLKNAAGKTALSSIDTNGTSIFGQMSLTEFKQEALKYHDYSLQLLLSINDINQQIKGLGLKYGIRPEQVALYPNDPKAKAFHDEYELLTGLIKGIEAQLNDPNFKLFDDAYKQLYTIDKEGFWASIGRKYRNAISAQTYDQYKDYVALRDRQRDIAEYSNILTEEDNKNRNGYKGADFLYSKVPMGAGYRAPQTKRNYTPEEILQLDVRKTAERSKELEEERKGYTKEYEENRKHLLESTKYWDVSKYYEHGVNAHQYDDLWNLDYAWYELPQMIGSTYSSPHQAISTMLSGISLAGYASSPWTGGIGAIIGAGSDLASTPFQIAGGYAENYAESGDKRIDQFLEILKDPDSDRYQQVVDEAKDRSREYWKHKGLDEEAIDRYLDGSLGERNAIKDLMMGLLDHLVDEKGNPYVKTKDGNPLYTNPIADPELFKARLYSTQGLLALFEANNMRTMAGTFFEKALTLTPTSWMKKAAAAKFNKITDRWVVDAANDVTADAAGRVTARAAEKAAGKRGLNEATRETYSNGFRRESFADTFAKGATRGAAIGEMTGFGFPGQIIGGVAGGTVNTAMRIGVSKLSPAARAAYRGIEEGIIHKYLLVYDKLLPNSEFGRAASIFGVKTARATLASQLSESAEEAVQYLNSKEDFASKYGWGGMSIGDMIVNDIYQGARVFDSYMSLFGLSNSELLNDAEYWANTKGGFALGGMHTGIMRAAIEGSSAYKEYGIHQAILTSGVMNREADLKDRAANVEFARQAMKKKSSETLSILEWMQKNDSRRENPYFTQEDYDEKILAANAIASMVDNKRIQERLEAKGIQYGTEEYANAIADLYNIANQRNKNILESREKLNNITALWNSPEYVKEAEAIIQQQLASSFEEHIGRATAIMEAGNKAVNEEIARAKQVGEDVESSDFKRHLQDIRLQAQDATEKQIDSNYRQTVLGMSHTAHKLQSLIKLRAQHNTISDFFTFLNDKFNIKPKRADAKLIVKSVDDQIERAKYDLAKFDLDFDIEMSDDAILNYIKTLPIVNSHSEDIERHEIAAAMLLADREVIDKHSLMFEYGLVQNKEGKIEYNPAAYKAKQDRLKKLNDDLRSGKINIEEYTKLSTEELELPEYNPKDIEDNPYKRRILTIIETRKENKALNYMINDIENGDGVVKILELLAEKEYKEDTSDEAKTKAKEESESFAFESEEEPSAQVETPIVKLKPTAKEKYQRRKAKANKKYQERKKSLKDLRNKAYATLVPIPTPLLDIANFLMAKAEIAVYKIAQFAEELKNAADKKGYNANSFLSGIKAFYIDKAVQAMSVDPSLVENFSTAEEIVSFTLDDVVIQQPIVSSSIQSIQERINKDAELIDNDLTTHYDVIVKDGDNVVVYPNKEAIDNARFEQNIYYKNDIEKLNASNTSDDTFRQTILDIFSGVDITKIPVDLYVKYRLVEGIPEAIANRRWSQEKDKSVVAGKLMRNTVLAIMFGKEDSIDKTIVASPDLYQEFRKQVVEAYNRITSKDNGMGLTIIDCNRAIYGTDHSGNRISSEADIIATDGTKLYAIDIRYSFQSLREFWNYKYERATYTINEHVTRRLKQIEQIINTKFNRGVNGLYCLGVVYNPEDKILTVDIKNGNYFITVRPDTQDVHDDNLDGQKDAAQQVVDEINKNISEYNILAEESKRYVDGYSTIPNIELKSFESVLEYTDYLNTLHAKYDHIIDKIDELKTLINQQLNLYNEVWNFVSDNPISVLDLPDAQQLYARLRDICADLDLVLDEIPSLKITTDTERLNIDKLIEAIFDALYLLDQLLNNSEFSETNFRAEQELIAVAIEKMVQNKDNFGKAGMFVPRWWATRFATGVEDNTTIGVKTISDIMFGYGNKIESWVNTLRNHVLSEIQDHYDLQQWYSTLLNNYLTQLLDNAQKFSDQFLEDAGQKAYIALAIKKGRDLIADFNAVWDTRPDGDFDGPTISPEVDSINRLPVRWMDRWGWSDSIMPAFDQMTDWRYYFLSLSPTFLDSTFTLFKGPEGDLRLRIDGVDAKGDKKYVTLTFENDISKAKNNIDRWQYVNKARLKFIRKALAAIDFVESHPGYEIRFDKTTNKGQILSNEDGKLNSVTHFIFADERNKHDLYTIKLSKKDRVGMLVTLKGDSVGPDVYSVKGGDNLIEDIGGFDRDYTKQLLLILSGAIVYFYDTGNGQYIGTPIQSTSIGTDDAKKLVYLILKYIEGYRTDQFGFDIMELLRLRLYMADPQRKLSARNNTNHMITINNGEVIIGGNSYNIISLKNALIDRIAMLPNVTRANMMNESLRTSENSVISRVRTLFGQSGQLKMQLTNGLVFDIEDFTHENADSDAQKGSTWLGYMMRNGLLGSSANKLGYKELRISNLRVLPKGFSEEKTVKQEIQQQGKQKVVVKGDDFFDRLAKLSKIVNVSEIDANRGTEEQEGFINDVKNYFDQVLGINGNVKFAEEDEQFLLSVSKNERIVGICTDEMIKLSRYVPMSVAWHEAFHKIFELVIPSSERDAFYKAYKNSIYGLITRPTDRDIAEAFADMFMTYMQNKQAIDNADTFFKKAKAWIKAFGFNIGMNFKIGRLKSKEMYNLYRETNAGKFKNTEISKEQHDRFKQLFGEGLYYTVTNIDSKVSADFSHISDVGARDRLVRGLSYYILKSYEIDGLNPNVARVRITGGTSKMKPTPDRLAEMYDGAIVDYLKSIHPVYEEVFEKVEVKETVDGKEVTRNYYPKFEALSRYISDYMSTLFDTMRKPKVEDDDASDTDTQNDTGEGGIDYMAKDTDHWDKAAYEFSKLDGLMDEVKLFFGTIPYSKFNNVDDGNGNIIRTVEIDYSRNEFGSPEFMPIEEVWNVIVKKFHDIGSIEEFDKALEEYSTVKEVYAQVYLKFHTLVYGTKEDGSDGIYKYNEHGDIIIALTDFDREAKAILIISAILSQNINFLVALSSKQKDDEDEGKSTRIVESSMDRDSKSYPDLWTRYLVSGQIGVFLRERGEGLQVDSNGKKKKTVLLFREGMGGKNGQDIFSRTAKFFAEARTLLMNENSAFTLDGINYDVNIFDDVNRLKDEIIHRLCTIGIMFERDALDYMLAELYGGVDIEALRRFLMDQPASTDPQIQEDAKKLTIVSFINNLNNFVSDGGSVNQDLVENQGYGTIGFVNKLAKYQGQYKRMSTLSMALALNGKKLFTISLNNTISHIIKQLNSFDLQNETIKTLSGFGYNVTKNDAGLTMGSIILKAIQDRKPLKIEGFTYIGFKTDNKGDLGSEYTEESTVEDYIAKMTMLLQGYLIFPTLADKGTWMLMSGVPIPGMKFIETKNDDENDPNYGQTIMSVTDAPTVKIINGKPYLIPSDKVLDQMIEYAKCEMLGIQQCMEDLGYESIPGYEKQGRTKLKEEQKIVNYHTKNNDKKNGRVIEPNGTRFLSLTAVVTNEYNPQTKKYELVTHNLNDPRESSVTLLKRAQDTFFARRDGESVDEMIARLRETMALTLAILTQHEVDTAVDLGIVKRISYSAKFGDKEVKISDTDRSILNLDSKDLNLSQIKALQLHIMRTTKTKAGTFWKDITDPNKRQFYLNTARSLAIAAILQDATNRHIICSLEVQRCFSGHPAFFKVTYTKTSIKDSAFDIQKRIGGMVSTGEDNILNLPGMKSEYVCAECEDYEIGTRSNIANRLEDMFSTSLARYVFAVRTGKWEDAYGYSIDKLKEMYPDKASLIDKALAEGSKYAKSFEKGINVADGASYITADMCRDMLRMRGAYNKRVRKAFKVLLGSNKYDWVKSAEAYKTVYEALNIVPTKYTAYGFRQHMSGDDQVSDLAVAYYNKFALFPVFPCMATGKMSDIYDKMTKEGVDMLLMTSAVKVGSQGAVSYDGNTISDPFNKYTLSYAYLRRQLNTDPEEKDTQPIGTQMAKIGLANLQVDRTYIDEDGYPISGQDILDQFMGSINSLADIGAQEMEDMFFDTEEKRDEYGVLIELNKTLNYEKLSDYLKELLTSRNANKTLIQSILVITDPTTGAKRLATPLAATTDAAWIESIFISTMNKKVVDITTPGKSFIQRSAFAIEGKQNEGEGLILGDTNMAPSLNNGQRLQMINEEGSMDCIVTLDYFQDILPDGLSFEQAKQWLIDLGIISGVRTGETEWTNAESIMIGYRIPTQAQSSIHALRIVDILPASKGTIILPEEFTKITGSDFDIDHLYLASYNFKKGEDGKLTRKYNIDEKEYHQNKILECLLILLKDTENSMNSLYKPVDNDTELITNVADQIPESGSTKADPYNFGTLHEQIIRKNDYITGKNGIAPFALNSTSHVLWSKYKVKFRSSKLVEGTRLKNFDDPLDKDDNSVASWLSGFINAHVDIVKDPYISKLNVNPFTYNMLNLMIRCGWGETALWFLASPIIRSMAEANDLADSLYMRRYSANKSGKSYREELIADAVLKYLSETDISNEELGTLLGSPKRLNERKYYINWLEVNLNKLKQAAISGQMDRDTAKHVFYAWKILEKYSFALGNLVQHTKVDTRKYGKNFIALSKYYQEYKEIFDPENPTESIWDIESLKNLERNSWIGKKTELVYSLPQRILGGMTFNANPKFVKAVTDFAKKLEYDGRSLYQDDVVNLAKHLLTAIKSKYFADYARNVLGMSDKDIANLFTGYMSMNRQLVSLKDLISNNPEYSRLASNPFLNQIYSMLEDKPVFSNGREMADRPGFVTVLDNVDDSKLNSDLLSEGWLDLMNDENPKVRKFAKKFIVYAFFSSGEFKGWNKLLKYVPYEWISGQVDVGYQSYSDFIEEELRNVSDDYSELFDDIVANNFMDYRFAKQMEFRNQDDTVNFLNADRGVRIGKGVKYDQMDDVASYISIKKYGMKSGHQDSYDLFKRIGFIRHMNEYHPVYAKIKKRGYHTRGNDIYEYGWDFNYAENERKGSDTFDYDGAIKRVLEYVLSGALTGFSESLIRNINKVYSKPEAAEYNYEWEYLEDSGYSGVLEELGLPEQVSIEGKPTYRPRYNFGRIYLTDNEKQYISESIYITDHNGNVTHANVSDIDSVIRDVSNLLDNMINQKTPLYISIPYRDWKNLTGITDRLYADELDTINQFDMFLVTQFDYELRAWHGIDEEYTHGDYNKLTKELKVEQNYYEIVKLLHDNINVLLSLFDIFEDSDVVADVLINNEGGIYEAFEQYADDTDSELLYSYSDKRQLELFSDEDFDPSFEEHCKHL